MRLELTRRGDYAIRAALALADANAGVRTGRQIAESTGIPPAFLPQVMGDLVRAGLARSLTGRRGGYQLGVAPGSISLLSVVEAVEGSSRRTTCVLRGGRCGADGDHCRVHDAFFAAQESLLDELAAVSLADLVTAKA
jgi:Rrf2 family protein